MRWSAPKSLRAQLLLIFICVAVVPMATLAWLYVSNFERMLVAAELLNLGAIADKKTDQINHYIQERLIQSQGLARDVRTTETFTRMHPLFARGGLGSAPYQEMLATQRQRFETLIAQGHYYDLMLTDLDGNVVFSLRGESDLGTNLLRGPFAGSVLADGHRAALDLLGTQITRADRYAPSNNLPALFIVTPVVIENRLVGTLALQLDIDVLTSVTTDVTGLGLSGETVLAQRTGDTALYINPLRHVPDAAFKRTKRVSETPPPMQASLRGESGEAVTSDYVGIEVLSAWRHLPALSWGMVVKMDTREALAAAGILQRQTYAALALLLFVSVLVASVFSKTLLTPLRRLLEAFDQLRAGHSPQPLPLRGAAELQEIGAGFNEMVAALEIQQQGLITARDTAERANAAKSEFLSRMSHELRTPLNAILGFAQILALPGKSPLTEQQADNVQEILKAGQHLLVQVNEVLDLSRIESGHIELSLEPLPLAPLIKDCVAQVQPLAAVRRITIAASMDETLALQGDYTRVKQIVLNLLSNAIKYNRDNGQIHVTAEVVGERVHVTVRDTGRGIAPEQRERLFKPFERLESSYDGIEGTGIGLALTKRLVEAMGGEIGMASAVGVGSTFWFALPSASLPNLPATPPKKVGAASSGRFRPVGLPAGGMECPVAGTASVASEPGTARHCVLYIEDNPANLKLVKKILSTRQNLTLLDAADAELGLEIARHHLPQVILLDINLPGMDGFAALAQLQATPATANIPVIAVTANAMKRDIDRSRAAGFADYLTKPLDIDKLLAAIESCLHPGTEKHP